MVVRLSALRTGRLYPPGNTPGTRQRLSPPQGHSAIGRILCQSKIPMTPAGIEPATFRFVAQHLNHWATAEFWNIKSGMLDVLDEIKHRRFDAVIQTISVSHGTCSYICAYSNAVANSVMLQLQHDFYNTIYKIEHELYTASGSAPPPPQMKNTGYAPGQTSPYCLMSFNCNSTNRLN